MPDKPSPPNGVGRNPPPEPDSQHGGAREDAVGGRPDRAAGAGDEHSWIHDFLWDADPWDNDEAPPPQPSEGDRSPDATGITPPEDTALPASLENPGDGTGPAERPPSQTAHSPSDLDPDASPDPHPASGPNPAADADPPAFFRTMPSGRISPILIPGEPTSSPLGRARKWIAGLLATESKVGSRRTEEESKDLEPADPDLEAEHSTGVGNDLRHRGSPAPARDQPIHRATTQMLPGRLHPLNPEAVEQEIRFLRDTIPRDTFKVTLGWDLGSPPEHVTLDHPSIQPLHAKMTYQNGQWSIETLADAYPVEINETVRLGVGVSYLLSDGDEIRIGKALFRFSYP